MAETALPEKTTDIERNAARQQGGVPIDWDAEVSLVANRDLFNRLAEEGYTAEQIAKLSVAQAKAIVGDNIETLIDIVDLDVDEDASPAEARVAEIQAVAKEADAAAKSAGSAAKAKDSK